MTSSTL